jgi:hypothetical protein
MFHSKAHIGSRHPRNAHLEVTAVRSPGLGSVYKGLGTIYTENTEGSRSHDIVLPMANPGLPTFYLNPTQTIDEPVVRENITEGPIRVPGAPLSVPLMPRKEAVPLTRKTNETSMDVGEDFQKTETHNNKKVVVESVNIGNLVHGSGSSDLKKSDDEDDEEEPKKKKRGRVNFRIQ